LGFLRSKSDNSMYYKQGGSHFLVTSVYVDYMLFFGNSKDVISDLKFHLSIQFHIKDFVGYKVYLMNGDQKRWCEHKALIGLE
jgi:hypothetical protein